MTDLRARRNALRGAEISVVELLFHTRTSVDRDDIRHEKTSKKHFVEVCLKHLKDRLKKLSTPRADKELSMMEAAEESCSLEWYLRRNAKRLFNVLGSKLTGDEWAKLLGLSLALAAANREKTVATKLINAGAAIASVVHAAVRGGSKDMVNFLLENGSSTSDLDFRGETPLHAAGRAGKLEIARLLLLRGADKNAMSSAGGTPLYWAARHGHTAVAEALLAAGADTDKNAMSSAGGTPLYWAARHGHTAVAEALLAAGADTTIRYTEGELSPLDAAVGFGYTGVMRALIEQGADVNAAGSEGQTALYWSIYANKAKAIDVLAEAGADMEARKSAGNLAGLAPLHLALHWFSFDAAFALLKNGADANVRNNEGSTPLHYAAAAAGVPGMVGVVDLLLRMGADETIANAAGRAPIASLGRMDLVRNVARVRCLLANAAGDRAWRRRGFLALCRAYPDRVQPRVGIASRTRSRVTKTKANVGASGGGVGGGAVNEGVTGEWGSVAAGLVELEEDGLFRKIVGYL